VIARSMLGLRQYEQTPAQGWARRIRVASDVIR
jgi:hypothetical protein